MTDLPPYTGDDVTCPKCAHQGAATAYRNIGDARAGDFFAVPPGDRDERLERRCPRCRYTWDEALANGPLPTTDRDRLLALLDSFNVQPVRGESCGDHNDWHVVLTAGDGRIDGEAGLHCLFVFDAETGAFKDVGVWS
jgi:rubredoxin